MVESLIHLNEAKNSLEALVGGLKEFNPEKTIKVRDILGAKSDFASLQKLRLLLEKITTFQFDG